MPSNLPPNPELITSITVSTAEHSSPALNNVGRSANIVTSHLLDQLDLKEEISTTTVQVSPEKENVSLPASPKTPTVTERAQPQEGVAWKPSTEDILTQSLNPSNSVFHSEGFYVPGNEGPCFSTPDQAYWCKATAPLLSSLLAAAKNTPELQAQYLCFFNHSIIPALGTRPREGQWTSHLTHNQSPFEPSLHIHGSGATNEQTLRFTFEPIGPYAGTPFDPFNQSLPLYFVKALPSSSVSSSSDLRWWKYFTSFLFVAANETERVEELMGGKAPSTCFLGFDPNINNFDMALKVYLFPHRRAALDGISANAVAFNTIRGLNEPGLLPALAKVEYFLFKNHRRSGMEGAANRSGVPNLAEIGTSEMSIEMIFFDCVKPETGARMELYVKSTSTSFSDISNVLTLGGRKVGRGVEAGIVELQRFWECVFGMDGEWDEDGNGNGNGRADVGFLLFGLEFRADGRGG